MHMTLSTCRTLALSNSIFFIDLYKRQDELDGRRNMGVISLECQSLDLIGNLVKKATNPTSLFCRSWGKVSLGLDLLPLAYLGMFFNKSIYLDKVDHAIQIGSKWLDVAKFVGVVALFYLRSFEAAIGTLIGLSLAQLQKNSKLPPAIYRVIEFLSTPLLILDFFLTPITGILSLVAKILVGLAIGQKFNTYLITKDQGIDLASINLAKPRDIDPEQVELYAQKLSSQENVDLSLELEFDTSSVHRIPQYLDITIQDNLQNATKEEIIEAFSKKIEELSLQQHAQQGLERLKKSYLLGNGSDVLPAQWVKFEKMFGLLVRHLLTLDKEELEPILNNLEDVGNHCVDGWVGELGAIYPDTQHSGLVNKIHADFAEERTNQLNALIISFHQEGGKTLIGTLLNKFIDLSGGINDVHYIQHLHFMFRPTWRTKLAEFAVTSSANQQDLFDYLKSNVLYKRMFQNGRASLFQLNRPVYWIRRVQELMKPQISLIDQKNGSEKVLKSFQTIPSQDLLSWIGENQHKYPLMDENYALNPAFFYSTLDDSGKEYLQLTEKGAALVLLDAGVLRVKAS